jgi:DNA-binding GntR family transcriptional regulator
MKMDNNGNKRERVYQALKQKIVQVELAPGKPIIEAEIAEQLGVSTTPIREALRQLEHDGLVYSVPARGCMVTHITAQEIHDVFQIREIIETGAAKRAALGRENPGIVQYREEYRRLLPEIEATGDCADHKVASEEIHQLIIQSLGNSVLISIYNSLLDRIVRILNYYGDRITPLHCHDIVLEHLRIAEAILDGNVDATEAAMLDHLHKASQFFVSIGNPGYQRQ